MKRLVCRWEMVEKKVTVDLRIGDDLLIVENVPATVCSHCGERVFTQRLPGSSKLWASSERNHRAP